MVAEGTLLVMYITPMLLGRTFDLRSYSSGIDIFSADDRNFPTRIDKSTTNYEYRIVDNAKDKREMLSASGELSLKLKSGLLDVAGSGSYLKDISDSNKYVEILIVMRYETMTETLTTTTPRADWTGISKDILGTHYVRSITYGGQLVASLRYSFKENSNKHHIKAKVNAAIQKGGTFSLDIGGEFEKMDEDLKKDTSLEIKYYGTVPPSSTPQTIEGLMALVHEFPEMVKSVGTERGVQGVPIRAELLPLNTLSADIGAYLRSSTLEGQMLELETKFDDLRIANKKIEDWAKSLEYISPNDEPRISDLNTKIKDTLHRFYEVIGNLNLTVNADYRQFSPAFDAYEEGSSNIPGRFNRMVDQLVKSIDADINLRISGGSLYTRWGRKTCDAAGAKLVYSGVMGGSSSDQSGNGANYLCLPMDPQFSAPRGGFQSNAFVNRVKYRDGHGRLFGKDAVCAVCHVAERSPVMVVPGRNSCPDGWDVEYKGFLNSDRHSQKKSEYICVDQQPEAADDTTPRNTFSGSLFKVESVCSTLTCPPYGEGFELSCAVCAMKRTGYESAALAPPPAP